MLKLNLKVKIIWRFKNLFLQDLSRWGRGQKFIQLALDKAKELNKNKVWLGVWEHNQQALSFYKKHGFEVTGQHEFITGEVVDIDLIMEEKFSYRTNKVWC